MTCMGLLQAILNGTPVHFDHLAFRTFGVSLDRIGFVQLHTGAPLGQRTASQTSRFAVPSLSLPAPSLPEGCTS